MWKLLLGSASLESCLLIIYWWIGFTCTWWVANILPICFNVNIRLVVLSPWHCWSMKESELRSALGLFWIHEWMKSVMQHGDLHSASCFSQINYFSMCGGGSGVCVYIFCCVCKIQALEWITSGLSLSSIHSQNFASFNLCTFSWTQGQDIKLSFCHLWRALFSCVFCCHCIAFVVQIFIDENTCGVFV